MVTKLFKKQNILKKEKIKLGLRIVAHLNFVKFHRTTHCRMIIAKKSFLFCSIPSLTFAICHLKSFVLKHEPTAFSALTLNSVQTTAVVQILSPNAIF
jgi:hypothetical protein